MLPNRQYSTLENPATDRHPNSRLPRIPAAPRLPDRVLELAVPNRAGAAKLRPPNAFHLMIRSARSGVEVAL